MRVPSRQAGFTLIELMIAITILAILILFAMPSYQEWIANSRIRSTSDSIQNGLRIARSQAVNLDLTNGVRFELTSANSANWTICVPASAAGACAGLTAICNAGATPAVVTSCLIQQFSGQDGSYGVLLGSIAGVGASYSTGVTGLAEAGVTFNSLGRPTSYGNLSIGRIDVYSSAPGVTRRLVNTVTSGGSVRMCDPQLTLATSPQGC